MNTMNATSETLAVHGDGLTWGISQPVHNFSNDSANIPRHVCIGIGGGIAPIFEFIPFHRHDV